MLEFNYSIPTNIRCNCTGAISLGRIDGLLTLTEKGNTEQNHPKFNLSTLIYLQSVYMQLRILCLLFLYIAVDVLIEESNKQQIRVNE